MAYAGIVALQWLMDRVPRMANLDNQLAGRELDGTVPHAIGFLETMAFQWALSDATLSIARDR